MGSPRIPFEPDGHYHIYNHAVGNDNIFREEENYDFFLRKVSSRIMPFANVIAYCLMGNHFHLQVQTRQANLKQAKRLLSGYAIRFNLWHRRAGPLFQGRYRAILAGAQDCITEVNRYSPESGAAGIARSWKAAAEGDSARSRGSC